MPSQGCCEWVGGEKSGGAQGGGGACLGGVLGRCAPGGLLCTLPCRLTASPCSEDPTILRLPLRWKEDAIPPGRHKRPSDLCLTCAAPTAQCVTGPAQLSPPTNIPAGGESPFLCPPQLPCPPPPHPNPSLPWHGFSFIARLAKSQPDPQPGGLAEEREGSPVPSQSPQHRQDRLRRKGSARAGATLRGGRRAMRDGDASPLWIQASQAGRSPCRQDPA